MTLSIMTKSGYIDKFKLQKTIRFHFLKDHEFNLGFVILEYIALLDDTYKDIILAL